MTTKGYVSATHKLDKYNEEAEEIKWVILQDRKYYLKNSWFRSQRAEKTSDWVNWEEHRLALKKPTKVQELADPEACEMG